ncbi:MAG: type II secretion system F family protein [Candidatus Aenigmatarchaeota archaeon]
MKLEKIAERIESVMKDPGKAILVYAIAISAAILLIGIVFAKNEFGDVDIGVMGNLVLISVFIIIGPYLARKYFQYVWVKSLEEQFPNFLRDLAESQRSGMNILQSISTASESDYGELTPEIKSLLNHLTWGISFEKSIDMFLKRTKNSELMSRSMMIIKEAYASGGSVTNTLENVANDVSVLKDAEREKSSLMNEHVIVMYAIFFMFLIIVIALTKIIIPMFNQQGATLSGGFGFDDPCKQCSQAGMDPNCMPCGIYSGICSMLGLRGGTGCYYSAIFFSMLILQGIFGGLVAGQISEGSATAGLKHSLIMAGVGFAAFSILVRLGFLSF